VLPVGPGDRAAVVIQSTSHPDIVRWIGYWDGTAYDTGLYG
jgi:hypothetical protein